MHAKPHTYFMRKTHKSAHQFYWGFLKVWITRLEPKMKHLRIYFLGTAKEIIIVLLWHINGPPFPSLRHTVDIIGHMYQSYLLHLLAKRAYTMLGRGILGSFFAKSFCLPLLSATTWARERERYSISDITLLSASLTWQGGGGSYRRTMV